VLEVEPADRNMLEVAAAVLANRTGAVPDTNADSGLVRVPVADAAVLPAIIRELDEARVELAEFTLRKASLDEVFLALTGREPADPENYDDNGKTRELERSPR
jgi:oleandomycin transport system ATP-binding protein